MEAFSPKNLDLVAFLTLNPALKSNIMCNGQLSRCYTMNYGQVTCFTELWSLLICNTHFPHNSCRWHSKLRSVKKCNWHSDYGLTTGHKAPKQQEPTLRPVLLKGRRSSDCCQPVTSPRSAPECLRTEKTAELNRVLCDTAHYQSLVGEESVHHGSLQAGSGSAWKHSEEKH